MSARLGDILVRKKQIAPHQLGVALSVQKKARLPLGQILLQNNIISRMQLLMALVQQKFSRLLSNTSSLATQAQVRLESHLRTAPTATPADPVEEMMHLREDLARLPASRAGRIVENDETLKERLQTGNF